MTKEPIMIDDVDVSGCEFYWLEQGLCNNGNLTSDCQENKDCIYKRYIRKQQECEELNKQLISFMNGDYCANGCSLKQQLYQLKADNETLEKVNKINQEKIKKLNEQLDEEFIKHQYGDEALFFETEDYKQALQEIKDYCNKYPQNSIGFKKQILQKCEDVL